MTHKPDIFHYKYTKEEYIIVISENHILYKVLLLLVRIMNMIFMIATLHNFPNSLEGIILN